MRLLVATTITQGARSSDFNLVFGTEPVRLARVCDRDGGDPDGPCGCRRAFVGIRSGRPTTTAAVAERDITPAQYRGLLRHAYRVSGYRPGYRNAYSEEEIRELADDTARELEQIAAELAPGAVVERRDTDVVFRIWWETAGLRRDEPLPDPDEPRHDNGIVSIDFLGDDDVFPAWVAPQRRAGWVVPAFTRDAARRVVDWLNRLHAEYPDGNAAAHWDGDDILLTEPDWEEQGPHRIRPDRHGRYYIGDGWTWTTQRCWICFAPARPADGTGSTSVLHEPGCPTTPPDQWPLAAHTLV